MVSVIMQTLLKLMHVQTREVDATAQYWIRVQTTFLDKYFFDSGLRNYTTNDEISCSVLAKTTKK